MSTKTPFPGFPGLSRDLRRAQAGVVQRQLPEMLVNPEDNQDNGLTLAENVEDLLTRTTELELGRDADSPKLDICYESVTEQGFARKLQAIASRNDDVPETLENKALIDPVINGTQAMARHELTDTDGVIMAEIYVISPGEAGNAWSIVTTDNAEAEVAVFDPDAKTIVVKEGITKGELGHWIKHTDDGVASQEYLWFNFGSISDAVIVGAIAEPLLFTGGSNGVPFTGTSIQLNGVVAEYHKNVRGAPAAPGATDDATEGYSIGSMWLDATSGAWYICTDATANNATWDCLSHVVYSEPKMPVTAKLTTGAGDSEIDWEADVAGKAGNNILLTFEVPATSLSVATNTAASEIILTAVKGVHPVSITLLGGLSQSLAVSAVGSDITVQLATDGSSVVTSTAADVLTAILAAMDTGQPLNGILSAAVEGASYVGTTLMLAQAIDYFDATADIVVDVSDPLNIIASVMYDGATDAPISSAMAMKNAVNLASELITGTVTGTGNDPVAEITEEAFTGGVNGTPAAAGAMRYEDTKLWISAGISTIAVSNWKYVDLT